MGDYIHLNKEKPLPKLEFGELPPGLDLREQAEEEAARDLKKPYEQLLADAHEELRRTDRSMDENIIHAQKRLTAITARAAINDYYSSRRLIRLTRWLIVLTVVLGILTIVLVVPVIGSWLPSNHREAKTASLQQISLPVPKATVAKGTKPNSVPKKATSDRQGESKK